MQSSYILSQLWFNNLVGNWVLILWNVASDQSRPMCIMLKMDLGKLSKTWSELLCMWCTICKLVTIAFDTRIIFYKLWVISYDISSAFEWCPTSNASGNLSQTLASWECSGRRPTSTYAKETEEDGTSVECYGRCADGRPEIVMWLRLKG